ncbi:MAG: hypothetical protein A7315_09865 [Candidatus Altiarchaeales archaeon WOR_SM1_79]|nr:MAG: hypothetical protein A7315_09865 [Candidatus Altiarchaeales archaeon WOR_SM1_79]
MTKTTTPTNINEIQNIKTSGIAINQIFSDHWETYFKKHRAKLRDVEIREVWKMPHCQDPSNGYLTFECPNCGETKTIHFNCNSRICTHCGKIYNDKWASDLAGRLFDVPHRHVIMTMSHYLWPIFKNNWELLKVVMDSAIEAIADAISKRAKRDLKPAFVVVLHTYGGDLKFNVHLHLLVAEGGFQGDKWVDVNVIPYTTLRHKWQEVLLTNLEKHLPDTEENRELMRFFKEDFKKDFFVNAKRRITGGKKEIARYIGRYIRHPAVANSRITNYDGKNVRFYYDKKDKDGKIIGRLYKTMEVEEFIEAIISHIPDNQFRTVRYYGAYWRIKKSKFKGIIDLETIYQKSLMDFIKISNKWAQFAQIVSAKWS